MSTDRTRRGAAPHDDGLDLAQLAADDAALDRLRAGLRGRSAPAEEDVALRLVQDLLRDVTHDLPASRRATEPLFGRRSERRLVRSGAVVAALAAGVLSLGGAAAAATLAPEGSALWGVGEAVRTATGAVVAAVTPAGTAPGEAPDDVAAPGLDGTGSATSRGSAGTPPAAVGSAAAAAARSAAAAQAVTVQLDAAERHLAVGRPAPARRSLEAAARRLPVVRAEDGAAALAQRLGELQARAEQEQDRRPGDPQQRPEQQRAPAAGSEQGPPPAARQQPPAVRAVPQAPAVPAAPAQQAPAVVPVAPDSSGGRAAPAAEGGSAAAEVERTVEPGGARPARTGTGDAPAPQG